MLVDEPFNFLYFFWASKQSDLGMDMIHGCVHFEIMFFGNHIIIFIGNNLCELYE